MHYLYRDTYWPPNHGGEGGLHKNYWPPDHAYFTMDKETAQELRVGSMMKLINVYIGTSVIFEPSVSSNNRTLTAFLGYKGRVKGSELSRRAFFQHVGCSLSQKFIRFKFSSYGFAIASSGMIPERNLQKDIRGGGINKSRNNYNKRFYSTRLSKKAPIYIGDCDSPPVFYSSKAGQDAAASNGILFIDVSNLALGRCIRNIPCKGFTYLHVAGVKDDSDMGMGFLALYVLVRIIHRAIRLKKAVLVNCQHGTSRSTAVVYAYCRAVLGMSNVKALATLREKRYQKALTSGASASFVLQIDTLLSNTPQQGIPNGLQADDWISSSCDTDLMSVAVRSMEKNNSLSYDASSNVDFLAHVSTQDKNSLSGDATTVTTSASTAAFLLESTQRKLLSKHLADVSDDLVAIRKEIDLSRAASASATLAAQAQFDALSDKLVTTLAHAADLKLQIKALSADALTLSNAASSSATVKVALQLRRDDLSQQMAYAVARTAHLNRLLVS